MLMICETPDAAERFLRIGDDLPMLVSTLDEVLHGDFRARPQYGVTGNPMLTFPACRKMLMPA